MNIIKRAKAPTPKFFRILRSIGLIIAAVGGTILAAPVGLPVLVTSLGGYLIVAGGVLSAVSQVTVEDASLKATKEAENRVVPKRGNPHGYDPDIYGD